MREAPPIFTAVPHRSIPWSVEKLPSTKLVPGVRKFADCWSTGSRCAAGWGVLVSTAAPGEGHGMVGGAVRSRDADPPLHMCVTQYSRVGRTEMRPTPSSSSSPYLSQALIPSVTDRSEDGVAGSCTAGG